MPNRRGITFLVGWVVDPNVAEFTIKFNNGSEVTLSAETHPYFLGILDEYIVDPYNPIDKIEVVEVIARDAEGKVIE